MQTGQDVISVLKQQRLLPLFYNADALLSVELMLAMYDAGIRVIEYTNRGSEAFHNFSEMKKTASGMNDLLLGVGTIKTDVDAQRFLDAGADFIISPAVLADVAGVCRGRSMTWIPGCMTPTEIVMAEREGAQLVKLFPGNILGPAFVKGIRELFPGLSFMPTGGVEATRENLRSWFDSGVIAVGMGSKLISDEHVRSRNFEAIGNETKRVLELIHSIT